MDHRQFRSRAVFALGALAAALLLLSVASATAAPTRLDCSLQDVETRTGSKFDWVLENRSITVVFDEQAAALTVYQDGNARALEKVSITQNSISGAVGDISLGVNRSSWSVVLQTYAPDSVRAEFGPCRLSSQPPPAKP